jgi:homogentisate phytyltransferase/homogentisate geranylgeranyltransferase
MAYAMIPALLMNLYITGLNQITDVEIDKINKPNLPIAAGILSMKTATITVIVSLFLSLFLGVANPKFATEGLNAALWLSSIMGTLYSLPPFRLKRFPVRYQCFFFCSLFFGRVRGRGVWINHSKFSMKQ